tara:strand:+ start:1088 stop:1309 length:222 start_codon:yes stop_codon:yes gene_type:complete
MKIFVLLLITTIILFAIPICILGLINRIRDRQPGCSGSHDCVIYKGEKVMCPSCEIREFKAEMDLKKQSRIFR